MTGADAWAAADAALHAELYPEAEPPRPRLVTAEPEIVWHGLAGPMPSADERAEPSVNGRAPLLGFGLAGDEPPASPTDEGTPKRRASAADVLVALAHARYSLNRADDGEPFAIRRDGPNVAHLFRGGRASLRAALAADYASEYHKVPPAQSLVDALAVLEGEALGAPRVPLPLRAARLNETVIIDMGGETGRAIIVDPAGWRIVHRSPVTFRRSELTGPLPDPAPDHGLDALARLVNVAGDDLPLLLAAMIAGLRGVPAPIVLLRGPEGAAKTTAAKTLVRVFDPSPAPVRAAPRDLESWVIAASSSLFVAIDNVSTIPDWLSDALCRAVTGEALVRRALYTDSSLSVVSFRRAIVMTSIDAGAVRGDLADRLLTVELVPIPDERRLDDEEVDAAFRQAHPAILGALLDLTSKVLGLLPGVTLARRPRMADYARILAAVDRILGTDGLGRYLAQRGDLQREAAEGDTLGAAILEFMTNRETWQGIAAQLLTALTPERPPKGWPTTHRALSGHLRRLVRPLAGAGILVTFERAGHDRRRVIGLERADGADANEASDPSRKVTADEQGVGSPDASIEREGGVQSAPSAECDPNGEDADDGADGTVRVEPICVRTVRANRVQADGADGADGRFASLRGGPQPDPDDELGQSPGIWDRSSPGTDNVPTIACSDYLAHQLRHRRVDGRWTCLDCEAEA